MHKRILVGLVLLLAGFVAVVPDTSAGPAPVTPPTCKGVPATKWLTSQGTLIGTSGPDVLVGSLEGDIIKGLNGNDLICGVPDGQFAAKDDIFYGGAGDDTIFDEGRAAGDHAYGEAGNDDIYVPGTVDGGSGDDKIQAFWGPDVFGGSGDDSIYTYGVITVSGGSGNDTIINDYLTPAIDCGSGTDSVAPGGSTSVKRCEKTL